MFKLSTTLQGHEQDVRAVVAPSSDLIVSGLRDATARVWHPHNHGNWASEVPVDSTIAFQSPTNAFINAVTFVPSDSEPLLAAAGQEAIIYLTLPQDNFVKPGDDYGKYQLIGHSGNICSLSYKDGLIISSSWDSTAKVWDLDLLQVKFDLQGHAYSVWDAKIVDAASNTFLTCSADRTIRKWVGNKEVKQYKGHDDVVRKLLILPGNKTFASASNDTTIRIWDLETGDLLNTLYGHDSFVYDLAVLSNGDLVSCGEDRTVRIWRDSKVIQAITLPCISVWCVSVLPNDDFVVGSSDNQLRVFTRSSDRVAPEYQLQEFKQLVQESAISEQSVDDLKKTDIPSYEALEKPGKQEGSTIMVKSPAGVIEAHQWSGGEWVKIGDVVGSAGTSGSKKEYLGKMYDYVFDVDVEDGKPPLKLPFNINENPYAAAERFLADNELPASYLQEVVQFIEQNTAGVQLEEQSGPPKPVPNPFADVHPEPKTESKASTIFPQKTLISFKDYKPEQLIKGLTKFNGDQSPEQKFSEGELAQIQANLLDLNSKRALELITIYLPKIINEWDVSKKLIGYDILRVTIPKVTTVDLLRSTEAAEFILNSINQGFNELDSSDSLSLPLLMMLLKVLNNLVGNTLFLQLFIDVDETKNNSLAFSSAFEELLTKLASLLLGYTTSSKQSKHYNTTVTSLASFIYNLSAFPFINSSFKANTKASAPVINFANSVADALIASSGEAAYRLSIAFGNYLTLKAITEYPSWAAKVEELYGTEQRFKELSQDLQKI